MSGATGTLFRILQEGTPLGLVLYPDLGALGDVIETVQLVAPESLRFIYTRDVEDAFTRLASPLLLTPDDEVATVRTLDGRREALLSREAPVILFLLKGGEGERALRHAPGLASWLQGRAFDPEPAVVELERERAAFEGLAGRTPRAFLAAWNQGELPDTLTNNLLYQRALLLEPG